MNQKGAKPGISRSHDTDVVLLLDRGAERAREVADRVVARCQERIGLRGQHHRHLR